MEITAIMLACALVLCALSLVGAARSSRGEHLSSRSARARGERLEEEVLRRLDALEERVSAGVTLSAETEVDATDADQRTLDLSAALSALMSYGEGKR